MTISNQKKLLVIFSILLFAGFLFFIPRETYAYNFTAGRYQDLSGVIDSSCPNGYWRAHVELKNYLGEPLLADELIVQVIWYPSENPEIATVIYSTTLNNLTSNIFETPCNIEIKNSEDILILEIQASKVGFYTIKAANNPRIGGQSLNQSKWSKTLYLAPLSTEEPNLVYLFPDNNQWISGADLEMKLWANKAPRPENITEIKIEIKHNETGTKVFQTITTDIDKGEVVFFRPALTGQGQYTWRVVSMRSTPSIFYNEKMDSVFNFDSNPPILIQKIDAASRTGKTQAPYIYAKFHDASPGTGMDKIELYLDNGQGGPLELVKTCSSSAWPRPTEYYCSYTGDYEVYASSRTYNWYAIGYDWVGNKTEIPVESFTIKPINPSQLTILSSVDNVSVTGVPFEITNITDVIGGGEIPAAGTYWTNTTVTSTADRYTITWQAPDSHDERPFSFWYLNLYNFSNSKEITRNILYGQDYIYTMHFGVSRLQIHPRIIINPGTISFDLESRIDKIKTRIEQTGGTPSNLLGVPGHLDFTKGIQYATTVVGEINNLVLKAYDSEDDVLKFYDFYNPSSDDRFCEPDPEDDYQCQGSISYSCRYFRPRYNVQRKVEVETYLGSDPTEGVNIVGEGKMPSGVTPYPISSTDDPDEFVGTLWAPPSIIDIDGNVVPFGYWTGCESVTPDKLGCYVGTGTWYNEVSITAKAHYTSSPEPPPGYCEDIPDGECKPGYPPKYCNNGTLIDYCAICGCPPGQLCDETQNIPYGACVILPSPPPTVDIKADDSDGPITINYNTAASLTWISQDADSCTASGDWSGSKLTSGSESTGNLTSSKTYAITCTGPGGSVSDSVTVDVSASSNQPPYIESQTRFESYCNVFAGQGRVDFQWIYRDGDLDLQTQFDFRVNDVNNVNDATPEIDRSVSGLNNPDGTINNQVVLVGSEINFNTTYYWWAKVYDNQGNDSGWVAGPNFTTDIHAYPWINFGWTSERPTVGEIVYFTDLSEVYGATKSSWGWSFQNGNPLASNSQNATTTFTSIGLKTVTLTVTDSDGFFCSDSKNVQIGFSLPKWKEVPPTF